MPEFPEILSNSFTAVSTLQAAIISLLAAITMRRYGSIVYFAIAAIVIDQFLTIALKKDLGASVSEVINQIIGGIPELDATQAVVRFIGYLILITIFYGVKALFRK